jgi:hypothetical protein
MEKTAVVSICGSNRAEKVDQKMSVAFGPRVAAYLQ